MKRRSFVTVKGFLGAEANNQSDIKRIIDYGSITGEGGAGVEKMDPWNGSKFSARCQ